MNIQKTCIICPNGCELFITKNDDGEIIVEGASCKRGNEYAKQEALHPMRTISSSVLVNNGKKPLVSVRLNQPVPKESIMNIMEVIRSLEVTAPIKCGQTIVENILGLGSDIIATTDVEAAAND